MDMTSSKNVEEVVMLLKSQLAKTVDQDYEKVWKISPLRILNDKFQRFIEQRI